MTYGRGLGVVVGTGMNTEVGKIGGMLASEQETETPLKQNLNQLGKMLTIAILVIRGDVCGRNDEWSFMD